ncbi:hypothetical protein WAU26_21740, partial [Xanthomonas phaseoli pv. dieffenbachiae]
HALSCTRRNIAAICSERVFVEPVIIVGYSRSKCNTLAPKSWLGGEALTLRMIHTFPNWLITRLSALHRLRWCGNPPLLAVARSGAKRPSPTSWQA